MIRQYYFSIVLRRSFQKVAGTVGIASVRAVGTPLGAKPIFPLHVISNACNVEIHVSFQILFFFLFAISLYILFMFIFFE